MKKPPGDDLVILMSLDLDELGSVVGGARRSVRPGAASRTRKPRDKN